MTEPTADSERSASRRHPSPRVWGFKSWRGSLMRGVHAAGEEIALQGPHGFLWFVMCFAAGIVLFFSWHDTPWPRLGVTLAACGFGLWWIARRNGDSWRAAIGLVGIALCAIGLGHAAAEWRTTRVQTPVLTHWHKAQEIGGRVLSAEHRPNSNRLILDQLEVPSLTAAKTPVRVRITVPLNAGLPRVGERILVRAVLRPPMKPVLPDTYPYQRWLYFEQIVAVGFGYGQWRP